MKINETREADVNVGHVLEETVNATSKKGLELLIFEGISNALDAQASEISITLDDNELIIRDNGPGMTEDNFDEAFNIGVRAKEQEIGIGHLGQGMKSGLLEAKKARLSTKSEDFSASCQFYTKRKNRAVEIKRDDNDPFLDQAATGTKLTYMLPAELKKKASLSKISDILKKWFPTLLDNGFMNFYKENGYKNRKKLYPGGVQFYINGRMVPREDIFKRLPINKVSEGDITRNYGHGDQIIGHYKLAKAKNKLEQYGVHRIVCGMRINTTYHLGNYALKDKEKIIGYVEYIPLVEDLRSNKEDFQDGMHYHSYFPNDFSNTIYKNFLKNEDLLRGTQSDDDLEKTWKKFANVFPEGLNLPPGMAIGGPSKTGKKGDQYESPQGKEEPKTKKKITPGNKRPKIQYINDPKSPIAIIEKFPDGTPYIAINKAHDMRQIDSSELPDLIGILYASIDYNLNNGLREKPDYILEAIDEGLREYARKQG